MKNKFYLVLAISILAAFTGFKASAQSSGGTFSITQSAIASGGGTSSNASFQVTGATGQPVTQISSLSAYTVKSGLFTAPPLAPTAAEVSVGGRVLTINGGGISRAFVSITDGNGVVRSTMTNPFGYYRFSSVEVGNTYIISVASKEYQFSQPTQILFVSEEFTGLNFVALP
jgi:hypothetical protein